MADNHQTQLGKKDSEYSAADTQQSGLNQELNQNVGSGRAQGAANPDLGGSTQELAQQRAGGAQHAKAQKKGSP